MGGGVRFSFNDMVLQCKPAFAGLPFEDVTALQVVLALCFLWLVLVDCGLGQVFSPKAVISFLSCYTKRPFFQLADTCTV